MNILVINCGSSSLKFQLIDSETEKQIAKGARESASREARSFINRQAEKRKKP